MRAETLAKKDRLYFELKRLLKKDDLYFYQNYAEKRRADFESLAKPLQTETQAKNLEADFKDSIKPT